MSVNVPNKMPVPFADAGLKNTIPANSDNVNGLAGYDQGFPPINMTPKTAGGIPPFGQDMNGILFAITEALRFSQAGSTFVYDSAFAAAISGYRVGALVQRTDGNGFWLNLTDGNVTDPESAGAAAAGWVPEFTYGISAITMTNANVTLTPLQYGRPIIVITGALTGNLNLIFPAISGEWFVINKTTGSFSITCKTPSGTGVAVAQNANTQIIGDATNIIYVNVSVPPASETVSGIAEIATQAEVNAGTDDLRIVTPLKLKSGFAISFTANGYIKLPDWLSGIVIQWGTTASIPNATSGNTSFPLNFPNNAFSCITQVIGAGNGAAIPPMYMASLTTAQFSIFNSTGAANTWRFLAIGN